MHRAAFIAGLASEVAKVHADRVALIAIDGVDAAGKTTLARELTSAVETLGRPVVCIGIDDFHHPARIRHRRGPASGEGYYRDAFDLERFRSYVLTPATMQDTPRLRTACHDLVTDERRIPEWMAIPPNAVVLVEGVFLHRPELHQAWHFSVFLRTTFQVTVPRAVIRDGGDHDEVRARYEQRYVAGQRLYLAEADPEGHATWVVDHDDPQEPEILRAKPPPSGT
jgi:uridine kinase